MSMLVNYLIVLTVILETNFTVIDYNSIIFIAKSSNVNRNSFSHLNTLFKFGFESNFYLYLSNYSDLPEFIDLLF